MFLLPGARKMNLLLAALTNNRGKVVVNLKNKTIIPECRRGLVEHYCVTLKGCANGIFISGL